jgi:hypothetical protein
VNVHFVVDNLAGDDAEEGKEDGQSSSIVRARISMSEYEQIVKPGRKITFQIDLLVMSGVSTQTSQEVYPYTSLICR